MFALLGFPLLVLIGYLAIVPSATRETFLSEFKHRTALLFGYEPKPILGAGGQQGLRSEHPEEYGMGGGDEEENSTEAEATTPVDTQAGAEESP
jgi:hypothetical protein